MKWKASGVWDTNDLRLYRTSTGRLFAIPAWPSYGLRIFGAITLTFLFDADQPQIAGRTK